MSNTFAGLSWEPIAVEIWRASPISAPLGDYPEKLAQDNRYLFAGDPFELEGTLSPTAQLAAVAAAVQETKLAYEQLSSPADSSLLLERRVRITRFVPDKIPAIYTCDERTRQRFGLPPETAKITPVDEDCDPLRAMVANLRRRGWEGAIIAPGSIQGAFTVLVPLKLLREGRLAIAHTGAQWVPTEVVEHTLGIRFLADNFRWQIAEEDATPANHAAGRDPVA